MSSRVRVCTRTVPCPALTGLLSSMTSVSGSSSRASSVTATSMVSTVWPAASVRVPESRVKSSPPPPAVPPVISKSMTAAFPETLEIITGTATTPSASAPVEAASANESAAGRSLSWMVYVWAVVGPMTAFCGLLKATVTVSSGSSMRSSVTVISMVSTVAPGPMDRVPAASS